MKNGKIANIKVSRKSLFYRWLEITKPFHKLTSQQHTVLSLLLYYFFEFKKDVKNDKLCWKLVFDYDTKRLIKDELEMEDQSLQNLFTQLRKKGVIIDNAIVSTYIPNLEEDSNNFKVIFNFNITEDE